MNKTSRSFTPKYWHLIEQFRQQIELGVLKAGDRLPSYTEMRTQFGASRPTAEKVHDLLERDGLIVREPGRGIFVAEPKVQEKRAVIGFGGLAYNASQHPYGAHILEGVRQVADREHVEILLLNSSSTIAWEKVDGVLICEMDPDLWLPRLPPSMPHVVMLVPRDDSPCVFADDEGSAKAATEHLIDLGHRRIGYLTAAIDPLSMQRLTGYRAALQAAHIDIKGGWVRRIISHGNSQSFFDRAYNAMNEWIADDWHELNCTALLAQNDDAALGAMQALRENGLDVPGDVSIVGYDGTELSRCTTPSLTTVEVPLREISIKATEMLLSQMNSVLPRLPHQKAVLASRLIVRESSASPRIP